MRYLPRALLAGGLGFAASVLVACGGSGGLLSADQAGSLNNQLDQLAASINAGQCTTAAKAAVNFSQTVNNLPGLVNRTLSNNLKQGAAAIGRLTIEDCGQLAAKIPTTSQKTTSTPSSTSTNTTPTNTATRPSGTGTTSTPQTTSTATTGTGSGSTSTSGGAGLPNGNTSTGGNGGAGTGNGNGR